jgi:hypothetical protein
MGGLFDSDWDTNQWTGLSNSDSGGGSSFDWGSVFGSLSDGGYGGGSDTSSGSSSSGLWGTVASWFGGGSGGGSGSSVNWGQAILSGLGSAADAYATKANTKEAAEEAGKQQRKTGAFAADLQDYYGQLGKQRKRTALDTYGQFSLTNRFAPNMTAQAPLDMVAKPNPGNY